eukprot:2031254-Amphidinium_carterae.1
MKPALCQRKACRRTCQAPTMMRFPGLRWNNWEVPNHMQHVVLPLCKKSGTTSNRDARGVGSTLLCTPSAASDSGIIQIPRGTRVGVG